METKFRLAADIGGTFTDVVLEHADTREREVAKVLTTYGDPAQGVMRAVEELLKRTGLPATNAESFLHGTTLATNALIQRTGAKTALLTTSGHRDSIEMALENRFDQYDINIDRPSPLVPRSLRIPIIERIDARGMELMSLDYSSVEKAGDLIETHGVESVAIGFLHSYVDNSHEALVADYFKDRFPGISLTLSSLVCPEIREYERLSTACANAYIKPLMTTYLRSLSSKLKGVGIACPMLLMTSGGGLTTLQNASEYPIRLVESGPAGGAILAAKLGLDLALDNILSFDMGGTTAKMCLISDGEPLLSRAFEVGRAYRFKKGSGLPIRVPVIEMVEIGAGGGSIARIDKLNRISVGPDSAGSEPGPACYGKSGTEATVTDADLVLGKLDVHTFAGGQLTLDPNAAAEALLKSIGSRFNIDEQQSAVGISEVVNENMALAARAHAMEWGADLQGSSMVAFGGAAPLHAAHLADKLKVNRIIIPNDAGVGSAIGFLVAPVSYEVVRSRYTRLSSIDLDSVNKDIGDMRLEAQEIVQSAASDGEFEEVIKAYMRYLGQGYEISVALATKQLLMQPQELRAAFEDEYRRLYGRLIAGLDIEVLSWTLTLRQKKSRKVISQIDAIKTFGVTQANNELISFFDPGLQKTVTAKRYARSDLAPGDLVEGPSAVIEGQTTSIVPSSFQAKVMATGDLLIERRGAHING